MYRETFPSRLKKARLDAGYTQKQIYEETGISQNRLSHYENGLREPDIETLAILAQFYNVDMNWLFGVSLDPTIRVPDKKNTPKEREAL